MISRLDSVLIASASYLEEGAVVVVEETRHRIRRLPVSEGVNGRFEAPRSFGRPHRRAYRRRLELRAHNRIEAVTVAARRCGPILLTDQSVFRQWTSVSRPRRYETDTTGEQLTRR